MAILGQGNGNLIQQIIVNAVNVFKKKKPPCSSIVDGRILKMHYQWTFSIFLFVFSAVWFSWYFSHTITCASKFNAEQQVRMDYINICHSYSYIPLENGDRSYVLFYRWIPLTMLVIACVFYIPRKISKYSDNPRLRKLVEDMAVNNFRYDGVEKELVNRASLYLTCNLRTHNGIYFKYIFCNILCLFIDVVVFYSLDVLFNGHFFQYGYSVIPFNRNVEEFTDYMSKAFPPFVECEIGPKNEVVNKRTERFGCHLQMMELYEKLFFVIWFWLIILIILTVLYISFLMFLWIPSFQSLLLKVPQPPNGKVALIDILDSVKKYCKIGDIYLLYRLKKHCSPVMYYSLLNHLSDAENLKILKKHPDERPEDIKNRRNKYIPQENFSSSDEQLIPSKRIPNTSILITDCD